MSSSSAALGLLLTAALATPAPAQQKVSACPTHQQAGPLSNVDVFDGPPSERADLVPDVSRGRLHDAYASWNVKSVFDQGRHLFLVCTYGHSHNTVTVEVENKVDRCIYRTHPHKGAVISCK